MPTRFEVDGLNTTSDDGGDVMSSTYKGAEPEKVGEAFEFLGDGGEPDEASKPSVVLAVEDL